MLIKYRHFVEYEIPYPSDWKEQLLEQVNDEKERELKRTTDDLPRFWTTRTSFIKEDEIDKIELQYKKYIFTDFLISFIRALWILLKHPSWLISPIHCVFGKRLTCK